MVAEKILPAVKAQCTSGSISWVDVNLFSKGLRIGRSDKKEYGYDQAIPGDCRETAFNMVRVFLDRNTQAVSYYKWRHLDVWNLADFREKLGRAGAKPAEAAAASGLNLGGVDDAYKTLFRRIYDEEFLELGDDEGGAYAPYAMFSGLISGYSEMCRSSLPPSAKPVDIYRERYMYTEYSFFAKTEYYQRYLAATVYMEPRYEAAFRSAPMPALKKLFDYERRESGRLDAGTILSVALSTVKFIPLAENSRRLISNNKCGNAVTKRFIDNLHRYVTGNWDARTNDGYKYLQSEDEYQIKRAYPQVPPTFSPKFFAPDTDKEVMMFLNLSSASHSTVWTQPEGLGLVVIGKLGSRADFSYSPFVKDLVGDPVNVCPTVAPEK